MLAPMPTSRRERPRPGIAHLERAAPALPAARWAKRRATPILNRLLVLALVSAVTGCDEASDSGPTTLESLPPLGVTEVMRIGDVDDPERGFSRIGSLDIDRDGNLYVMEVSVPEIRVYSPDGARLRSIGGRGQGPGEFGGAPRFGVKGDTVWTIESFNGRLTLFDRQGEVLTTGVAERVVVPLPTSLGFVVPESLRDDGTFGGYFGMVGSNRDGEPTEVEATDSIPWPIVRFDPSGAVLDTLGWVSKPPPRMWRPPSEAGSPSVTIEIAGRRVFVPSAPTNLPRWHQVGTDRVIVDTPAPEAADGASMSVTRVTLDDDTVFHRVLAYTPVPYGAADLDSIAARAARGEPGGFAPYNPNASAPDDWEAIAHRLRAEMAFPEFQLPLEYSWPAPGGGVWLRRAGDRSTGNAEWAVVDGDGEVRGRLELPYQVRPLWARGDTLWATEPDDLEIPWLVRYEITGG